MKRNMLIIIIMLMFGFPFRSHTYYAEAALVVNFSLDELCKKSDAIVIGRCVDVKSQWRGKVIVTVATVKASSYLKGNLGGEIEITTLGGRARVTTKNGASFPVRQSVQGSARFSKGEEVLVFLKHLKGGNFVVGMQQGKQTIVTDKATGEKFVFQRQGNTKQKYSSPTVSIRNRKSRNIKKLSLADYTAQIVRISNANLPKTSGTASQAADSKKK